MKTNYDWIRNIFIQSSLTNAVLLTKVKALNNGFIIEGELNYLFWRYVYMKDLTKTALTNQLLKAKFDNLTTIEIINALNETRKVVKYILEEAKKEAK